MEPPICKSCGEPIPKGSTQSVPRWHTRQFCSRKCRASFFTGEKHPHWKGDEVSYLVLHAWIRKRLPQPPTCEHCGATDGRIDAACRDGVTYSRNVEDFMWLCWPCHARHDAPRRPRGEEHAMAKLTEDEVREIRQHAQSRAFTHKQLAATFGVSRFAIQSVIYRKSWAHVE